MSDNPAAIERFNVLGVSLCAMDLKTARKAVLDALKSRRRGYVCVTDVHVVVEAQGDPEFRRILNEAFLTVTDGMPLVWLGRRQAGGWVDRVCGRDIMLDIFEATRGGEFTHFLYGGAPGVADELRQVLEERCPGARVVGTYCPPFRPLNPAEKGELAALIKDLRPDIMWVGLGAPKQERFMAENLGRFDVTLMVGVGAAFDFLSGRMAYAPRWMQRSGLEWLFRLSSDPRRLAPRYGVSVPLFLWHLVCQLSGLRKYPLD